MPLLRVPTTEELEDHFFGSGAFSFGWFSIEKLDTGAYHFPVRVVAWEDDRVVMSKIIAQNDFIEGIKKYASTLSDRSYDDLLDDMDASDVDNVIQLIMFNEIRYS